MKIRRLGRFPNVRFQKIRKVHITGTTSGSADGRFFGSTKATSKKDAEVFERNLKAKTWADIEAEKRSGNAPMTLDQAAFRYWQEVGQHHAGSDNTWRDLDRLNGFIGKNKRLDSITDADVAALVAWRRAQTVKGRKGRAVIAPATVNRSTLEPLKKIFTRAKRVWHKQFPLEPNWSAHRLKEPEERVRNCTMARKRPSWAWPCAATTPLGFSSRF